MVFNASFNNISAISWRSFVLVKETAVPGENHRHIERESLLPSFEVLNRVIFDESILNV